MLGENESFQRTPAFPAGGLQPWPRRPLVRIAGAQPGDRDNAGRQAEQRADVLGPVERNPSHPDTFGTRGQPEILYRQARAVQVGVADRMTAQHLTLTAVAFATNADAERGFADAFDLEVEVL